MKPTTITTRARQGAASFLAAILFPAPASFPAAALFAAATILCLGCFEGCGESPLQPVPTPEVPHLSGVIRPPEGLWLSNPTGLEVAPDGRLFVQEGRIYYDCRGNTENVGTRVAKLGPVDNIEAELPIALDRFAVTADRVFVVRWWEQRVEVYDHSGTHLSGFTLESAQPVNFAFEFDIAASADGRVYVLDPALRRVQSFSADGQLLATWGGRGTGPGQMEMPGRIVIDGQGNVYVLDVDLWRVQKFSPDGALLMAWDLVHSVQFGAILEGDLAVDGQNRPIVLDVSVDDDPGRVVVLGAGGGEASSWRLPAESWDETVACPAAIAARGNDELVFVDDCRGRLARFSTAGEFLGTIEKTYGVEPGELLSVASLAAMPDGNLVVLDDYANRLERYAPDGTHLGIWPAPDSLGMEFMASTADGNLWLAQGSYGGDRVIQISPSGAILHDWKLGLHASPGGIRHLSGTAGSAGYEALLDMAVGPSDLLAFLISSSTSGRRIELRTPDGQPVKSVATPGGYWGHLAVDAGGRAWLTGYAGDLEILDLWTGNAGPYPGLQAVPGGADQLWRIALDGQGNVYLLAGSPPRILLFDRQGVFAGEFGRAELGSVTKSSRFSPSLTVSSGGMVAATIESNRAFIYRP